MSGISGHIASPGGVRFDNLRELMNDGDYVSQVNETICTAKEVSDIEIGIKEAKPDPYNKKLELRHQELYESDKHLNELRRPIWLSYKEPNPSKYIFLSSFLEASAPSS